MTKAPSLLWYSLSWTRCELRNFFFFIAACVCETEIFWWSSCSKKLSAQYFERLFLSSTDRLEHVICSYNKHNGNTVSRNMLKLTTTWHFQIRHDLKLEQRTFLSDLLKQLNRMKWGFNDLACSVSVTSVTSEAVRSAVIDQVFFSPWKLSC